MKWSRRSVVVCAKVIALVAALVIFIICYRDWSNKQSTKIFKKTTQTNWNAVKGDADIASASLLRLNVASYLDDLSSAVNRSINMESKMES